MRPYLPAQYIVVAPCLACEREVTSYRPVRGWWPQVWDVKATPARAHTHADDVSRDANTTRALYVLAWLQNQPRYAASELTYVSSNHAYRPAGVNTIVHAPDVW